MRAAPPVDLPLSHGTGLRALAAGLHGLAGAGLFAWALAWAQALGVGLPAPRGVLASPLAGAGLPLLQGWPGVLGLVLAALLGAALGWRLWRGCLVRAGARLRWDGQAWCLLGPDNRAATPASPGGTAQPAAPAGPGEPPTGLPLRSVARQIDLDRWLLLRLHPGAGRPRWAVASAGTAPLSWHAARLALVAHGGRQAAAAPAGP